MNLLRAFDLMGGFRAQSLLRAFDLMGGFRAQSLQATIVDNVLHITFDVRYSEIKTCKEIPKMESHTTNTGIKE